MSGTACSSEETDLSLRARLQGGHNCTAHYEEPPYTRLGPPHSFHVRYAGLDAESLLDGSQTVVLALKELYSYPSLEHFISNIDIAQPAHDNVRIS